LVNGGNVSLTATGGGTYQWSTGATTATLSNITASGTYSVTVVNGTCTATASQIVTANPPPTATITSSGATAFCQGGSANLTASGGTAYLWSDGSTLAILANISTSGTYAVTVTNGACTATNSKTITVTPTPTAVITASGATSFCQGGSVNLTASGGTTYAWSNGSTLATLANITASGTYSVTATNGTCTSVTSKIITVDPLPTPSIAASGTTTFCQGGSVDLTASGGSTYLWSTGVTSPTIGNLTTAGTYSVTATNGNCSASASATIVVNKLPVAVISASGPTVFCAGKSVNLTASGGSTYTWATGQTGAVLSNITASATYTVTVTNATGCSAVASQIVSVVPIPIPSIVATGATTFCEGGSVNLTAYGGSTYTWSNGATTPTTLITAAGTYSVTVANGACTSTADKVISTLPTPSVNLSATPSNGSNGTATAAVTGGTPPYIYDWSNNATNYTLIGLSVGTYFVTVTDANGCTKEGSVNVPSITATSDITTLFPMSISPNPNDGYFLLSLDLPVEQDVSVEIFNMVGKQVAKRMVRGKSISTTVNLTHLAAGQYLVKINTEMGRAVKWMVVAK
jgi:hypothetical protein